MRKLIVVLLLAPLCGWAAEAGYRLDSSPHDPHDLISLQAGARTYVNYCLGCHGVEFMRYSELAELGLNEAQIRNYLMFTADKVGEPIRTVMPRKESKSWFGVTPPTFRWPRARAAPIGSTPICALSIAIRRPSPAGTTPCSRTSPCRTRYGRCRASAPTTGRAASGPRSPEACSRPRNTTRRCATWSISWCTPASPPPPGAR